MSAFIWVARHRALAAWRAVAENAFSIFVMGPLIVGGAGVIFQEYFASAGRVVRGSEGVAPAHGAALAGAVFGAVLVARLSGAIRAVYALEPADHYLEALPIGAATRLHLTLASRLLAALPPAVATFAVLYLASPKEVGLGALATSLALPLAATAATLAVIECAAALAIVRIGSTSALGLALAGAALVASSAALVDAAGWRALAVVFPAYGALMLVFRAWRTRDRERAREALARARRTRPTLDRLACRAFGPRVGALAVRDLRLVRRGFSSAVYAAAGLAVVAPAGAAWIVGRGVVAAENAPKVIEAACVVSAFALSGVTHVLAQYQRSRVWLDVTSGAAPDDFPRAKRVVGRVLGLFAVVAAAGAFPAAGLRLDVAEVAKLVWLAWATSTITSVLCYEVEDSAAPGLVFAFIASAGLAALFVAYPSAWPFWFIAYYYASTNMFDRAAGRGSS